MIFIIVLFGLISIVLSVLLFRKFQSLKHPSIICLTYTLTSVLLILMIGKVEKVNLVDLVNNREPKIAIANEQSKVPNATVVKI